MESSNSNLPSYDEATGGQERPRIIAHLRHCSEQSNEEYLMSNPHLQSSYLPIREWAHNMAGTTTAKAPWWLGNDQRQNSVFTWQVFQETSSTSAASTEENVVEWLRRLCMETAVPPTIASGGTPLRPGDIEYTLNAGQNWTHNWGWEVALCAYAYPEHIRCSDWSVTMRIYLHDLPHQLRIGGIQWREVVVSDYDFHIEIDSQPERGWDWKLSSTCAATSDTGRSQRNWEARTMSLRRVLPSTAEFWGCLSEDTIFSGTIKQRTGRDKYKMVMWYSHLTAYANDLTEQTVGPWHDGFGGAFAEFIRPLVPRGSSRMPNTIAVAIWATSTSVAEVSWCLIGWPLQTRNTSNAQRRSSRHPYSPDDHEIRHQISLFGFGYLRIKSRSIVQYGNSSTQHKFTMATTTTTKSKFHTMFYDDPSCQDNKMDLFAPSQSQDNGLTAFEGISPSNIVPLRKLKQWPRAVLCPACRELSITRVERKICSGTHVMAAFMLMCTIVGGPVVYMSKAFKNVEHYCCRCNRRLATFHFNTGTEIHVY
ncbi:uncharacterized protein NECHADRAFT_77065 [Fusarium vanettenii 77-13-4]|uniref:LITAF domain-containing protein n=1 Tax=Fusarium vanettenii (strain ATCC MYA-4622 / CBS 123669 / FGSC 9596 / NRRL 45880 / 77-13-4) TaxID=660122 RepID=C7ZCI6_FUSV7|nr:uncharacterized protein NECHADRAFT_77065 [Fusarium vanettenii 77-13-4]EEU38269.1 hypothetical protein NECHADRAFT_77065 [Fusarium vanettenii 77-13-4]